MNLQKNRWETRRLCSDVCLGVGTSGLQEEVSAAPWEGIYGQLGSLGRLCLQAEKGFQELKCLGHKIIFMAQVAYFGLLQDEATCYEYMKNIKRPASIGKSQHLRLLRPSYQTLTGVRISFKCSESEPHVNSLIS